MTETDFSEVVTRIRKLYPTLAYDHRPDLISGEGHNDFNNAAWKLFYTEEYRVGYACFKYAVASVLQPKRIVETGVYCGNSAMAFLAACPTAHYIGIDSKESEVGAGYPLIDRTMELLRGRGYSVELINKDTKDLLEFPQADFIHVDADHSREGVARELRLALKTNAVWILLDDTHADFVMAGIADVLDGHEDSATMRLGDYPETYTGSIIIGRGICAS